MRSIDYGFRRRPGGVCGLVLAMAMLSLAGCGPRSVGATVTGTITIDGKPAPRGLRIDFAPQVGNPSPSTGFTDEQGRYVMMFNAKKAGVLPGECLVRISIPLEPTAEGMVPPPQLRGVRLPDSVSSDYTLRYAVKPGANTIDIAIETKPSR